ncbi:MAG: Alpha-1,3-mannosyltransferase-like protein [Chaenotheca gracillima]|nr:MAG: Alpha-1,3-mannosyltransferase-like protein [Chaenotheca gracillima]
MSDDEADPELLELLRQSLGIGSSKSALNETKVLESAEYVYDNSIDVALVSQNTKAAARLIWAQMQQKNYSTKTWSEHQLHPQAKDESTVNFIFTMDLLNFSFWSEKGPDDRFAIEYQGRRWTGYWSLVAALRRALDEGIPITSSDFWQNEFECNKDTLRHVFRSATNEEIPLLDERLWCLQEAGHVLYSRYNCRFANCIQEARGSAASLVNILSDNFSCLRDEVKFEGKKVRFLKRAQLIVADLWACFDGASYGEFYDIDKITMFAGEQSCPPLRIAS